jgi:transposase
MIYLGIDIAKNTHVAAAMSAEGQILIPPFSFSNDIAGFSLLHEKIASLDKEHLLIGLESTAHYAENVIFYLLHLGYKITVINPLQTASLRRTSIRKTKTDKVDSFLIVKAMILNNCTPLGQRDVDTLMLRNLCKARQNLMLLRTRCKIQLGAFVDQLFPELNSFFQAGLHINTSYQLLKRHSRPCEIQTLHLTYLSNLLLKASRGKYTKLDASRLKALARTSIGIDNPVLALQIQQTIAQIELFNQQLDEVTSSIQAAMVKLNSPILTVPGIGFLNGAMILSSIGDITRFSNPSKLLAYAGLDPAVNQSGQFSARSTRMSKRGSSMLRYALINAAHNVARNNATFGQYYATKIAQGKSHYCALGHTAHKLVRVLYALLTKNIAFDLK